MATRLRVRLRKQRKDMETAVKKGETPTRHKIDDARSKKVKSRKINRMA